MTPTDNQSIAPAVSGELPVEVMNRIAEAVIKNDLKDLKPMERVHYVKSVCDRLGIDYLTKPFDFIENDKGGVALYPNKECAAQLRQKYGITVRITDRQVNDHLCIVTAQALMPNGRADESIGAVAMEKELGEWKTSQNGKKYFVPSGKFQQLSPEAKANAIMRAETKSKRRATFSLCGLGMADAPDEDAPRWDYEVPAAGVVDTSTRAAAAPAAPAAPADPELDRRLAQFGNASREQRLTMLAELRHDLDQTLGAEGVAFFHDALKAAGVKEPDQLSSMGQAKQVYTALWSRLQEGVPVEEEPVA